MAAKLLHSLADDNPDLQKQIGCMNGIFHIFDRQQLLSGRRPTHRKLLPPPPGSNSEFSNGELDADSSNSYNCETLESNPNSCVNEKRGSTESSRASFSSSSRSSSFSSIDCVRTGHPEPSSMDRIIFPETPSRDSVISQTSASPKMGRLSVDIRDVVKDSMNRDSRGLSVQTTVKEDGSGHPLKHNESSPRLLQFSKSVDGPEVGVKGNCTTADIKESLRVLAKLRDAQLNYNEKELPRLSYDSKEGSFFPAPKDAHRFSYDGRELHRKIKDIPRLSLDSKESLARGSIIDSKLSNESSNERGTCVLQPTTNQSRPSSVVAKLMGLDLLPDAKLSSETCEDSGPTFAPLRVPDGCRPVRLPKSPRSTRKESTSPRWKNSDMKPVSASKFPIEPAPWKHMDAGRGSPKHASKQTKSSPSTLSSSSPSVYGEIEKRLKDIEFKQSGKDLRALKQILEAMQAKGLWETTKDEQSYDMGDKRDHGHQIGLNAGMMSSNDFRTSRAMASRQRGGGTSKAYESPIVIMKPAKLVQKSGIPASSIVPIDGLSSLQRPQSSDGVSHRKNSVGSKIPKDQTIRDSHRDQTVSSDKRINNRNFKVTPTSSRPSSITKDNNASLSKNSGSVSPRLQQKKPEFDKRSRPPTPPGNSNKSRRQPAKQSTESVSPGGRPHRAKISSLQQNDGQSNVKCSNSSNLSNQEDNVSEHSDTNLTRIEGEGTCTEQHVDVGVSQSISGDKPMVSEERKEDVSFRLNEETTEGNLASAPEQPSPVSVLDSSALMEDSLSPVKQTSHTLQVAESNDTEEELWSTDVNDASAKSIVLELIPEMSRKKLQSIDSLVQKLTRLNSTHNEAQTDYIASLCENPNPDHRYISEILLASGLLLRELSSGLTAFQLHPSGHPINPELFYVLEQTKASSLLAKGENVDEVSLLNKSKPKKLHRKLIFDAVNEILTGKLAVMDPPTQPGLKPSKIAKKTLNAQKLLRELCSEIQELQVENQSFSLEEEEDGLKKSIFWEDVMHRSGNWNDFQGELSSIVLDVERSIFKELVDEIVLGEEARLRHKPNRRCRQLFSK